MEEGELEEVEGMEEGYVEVGRRRKRGRLRRCRWKEVEDVEEEEV